MLLRPLLAIGIFSLLPWTDDSRLYAWAEFFALREAISFALDSDRIEYQSGTRTAPSSPALLLDRLNDLRRGCTSALAKSIWDQMRSCDSGEVIQTVVESVVFSARVVVQRQKGIVGGMSA
jgi:hypothetical protein